jgi:hypothetical protein
MKLRNIAILIVICVILSQICIAKSEFERFKDKFNTDYEIGSCAKSYVFLQGDNLTTFRIKTMSGIQKGNDTFITIRCNWRFDTILHTHPNNYCEPSGLDLNTLKNSKSITTSIIVCQKEYLVMIKHGSEIKQFRFQS